MPYMNESALAYYDGKLKEWVGDNAEQKTVPPSLYPWTQTAKAGAVTCWPVGETPLETSVDFLFTETPPSNGQPKAPDNPSTITGVSSIECSYGGKNLLYYPLDSLTKTTDGVTFTYNNGFFSTSGTSAHNPVIYRIAYSTGNTSVYSYLPAGTYTLSGCPASGSWSTYSLVMMDEEDGILQDNLGHNVIDYGSGRVFTIDKPKRFFCMMRLGYAVDTEVPSLVYTPQLEIGNATTSFEPADRTKLSISLGSTYYGGSIDLSSGVMTVTWQGIVLDDSVAFASDGTTTDFYRYKTTVALLPAGSAGDPDVNGRCSHMVYSGGYSLNSTHCYVSAGGVLFITTSQSSLSSFNSWITSQYNNGTPVAVVYKLATSHTVQLTPQQILSLAQADKYTPRLNTVYTDASSVQVGYVKSPIRTEFELQQAIVGQGGNI